VATIAEKINDLYRNHGEKLRYVVVGGWNTLFNIILFNVLLLAFGHGHYLIWFWVAWSVSVCQSTTTMKFLVFRKPGHLLRQIGRAFVIYLPAQGLSTAILWFGVQVLHMWVPLAQLCTIAVTTVFSYLGHKYFTFRLSVETEGVPEDETDDSAAPQGATEA
jgi:putative flippase GtrA